MPPENNLLAALTSKSPTLNDLVVGTRKRRKKAKKNEELNNILVNPDDAHQPIIEEENPNSTQVENDDSSQVDLDNALPPIDNEVHNDEENSDLDGYDDDINQSSSLDDDDFFGISEPEVSNDEDDLAEDGYYGDDEDVDLLSNLDNEDDLPENEYDDFFDLTESEVLNDEDEENDDKKAQGNIQGEIVNIIPEVKLPSALSFAEKRRLERIVEEFSKRAEQCDDGSELQQQYNAKIGEINNFIGEQSQAGVSRLMHHFKHENKKLVSHIAEKIEIATNREQEIQIDDGITAHLNENNEISMTANTLNSLEGNQLVQTCVAMVKQGLENTDLSHADDEFFISNDNVEILYQAALAIAATKDKVAYAKTAIEFNGDWSKLNQEEQQKLQLLGITKDEPDPEAGHLQNLFAKLKSDKGKNTPLRTDYEHIKNEVSDWEMRQSVSDVKMKRM